MLLLLLRTLDRSKQADGSGTSVNVENGPKRK